MMDNKYGCWPGIFEKYYLQGSLSSSDLENFNLISDEDLRLTSKFRQRAPAMLQARDRDVLFAIMLLSSYTPSDARAVLWQMKCPFKLREIICTGITHKENHRLTKLFGTEPVHHDLLSAPAPGAVEVIVMTGIPGSGKDTWIRNHAPDLPMVSLDAIKEENGWTLADTNKAKKVSRERMTSLIESKVPFVYNATNLTRKSRKKITGFLLKHNVKIKIVYVETTCKKQYSQNKNRDAAVPERAINSMLTYWSVPQSDEGHEVSYYVEGEEIENTNFVRSSF